MIKYYILSFLLTLFLVYVFQKIALKLNIVDKPNYRKVHKKPKALLGGMALYFGVFLTYLIYNNFDFNASTTIISFLSLMLVLLGLYDDIFDMKATYKLLGQIVIAFSTAYVMGGINGIEIYNYAINFTKVQGIIIQGIWIVTLINAFNLIDGLDGLSTGVGIISLSSLLILSSINGDSTYTIFMLILIASLFAFLYYNFNPSTIFLGDSGSMLIGYLVALTSMNSYKTVTLTSMMLLLLIAFMPFFDVFLAIVRRKANKKRAFAADSLHFHHRLMLKGYSHTKSVLILYLIMITYSIVAIALELISNRSIKIFLTITIVFLTILIFERLYLLSDKYAFLTKSIKKITKKTSKNNPKNQ